MRLIDAGGLIENIEQMKKYQIDVDDVLEILDNTPTIEAAPVVRGVWLQNIDNYAWECSECHYQIDGIEPGNKENFCASCGAKMRTK